MVISRRNVLALTAGALSIGLHQSISKGLRAESGSGIETSNLTPDQALDRLVEGNKRFVNNRSQNPNQTTTRLVEVAQGQEPFAAILGCADSRVPSEIIFDQGLGDLFVCRVAGNRNRQSGIQYGCPQDESHFGFGAWELWGSLCSPARCSSSRHDR